MDANTPSRRLLIRRAAGISFGLAALAASAARAEAAKISKSDVKYQFTPKGADRCGDCLSFIPAGASSGAPGTCKAVDGPIPQNGWCLLFARRKQP